jgi:fatty-acyl-CoA synthase
MNVQTVTPAFLDRAGRYYDDVVGIVANDGTEYTYGEVTDRVDRLSNALVDLGVDYGDRVAVLSPNTHWCIETLFAVQQLGAVFVPLNYRLLPGDYEYLLTDSGASVVVADYEYADELTGVRGSVPAERFVRYGDPDDDGNPPAGWLDYESLLAGAETTPTDRPAIAEDDPAAINYTSGTTGDPKGVVRTHRTDVWNAVAHGYDLGVRDDGVYLWTLPMFHVHGWGAMYTVTGMGATHVCLRGFDAETVFDRIREYDVTHLSGAPTVLNRLLEHAEPHDNEDEAGETDLRTTGDASVTIATAGAPPPSATIEAVEDDFGWELVHCYGHTESGPYTTSNSPHRIDQHGRTTVKPKQGIPFPCNEMRVVDARGEDVPRDDETMGEVVLRGPRVFDRYWNKPTETEAAFSDRVEGWFHSGDLGTVDEHGFITLKDRKKDVIVSGGENISSIEVEDAVYDLSGVAKATVIPVPHEEWGETPKALVVPTPDADLTAADVVSHCKNVLAGYKAPTVVEFVDELPETATGKVKKHELRKRHWSDRDRMIGGGT